MGIGLIVLIICGVETLVIALLEWALLKLWCMIFDERGKKNEDNETNLD